MPSGDPLVSIRCTVYNHEPFLRQCLDGFVMQKTTFPFEAIVHDDASTDGSAAIIREYAEKYPDIIKPIYETENQYSKGDGSLDRVMAAAIHPNAKYIALCEGDDYWTDPHKLQLQVDFLESHPDYFMSCHGYEYYYENIKEFQSHPTISNIEFETYNGREYCTPSVDHFFNHSSEWFTQILTIVIRRKKYIDQDKLNEYNNPNDTILCYYMMKAGKCAVFKDVMGVYRKHDKGVYSGRDESKWIEELMENYYCLYELEKEELLLPILDIKCARMVLSNLKELNVKKAIKWLYRHFRIVPVKHSMICVNQITLLCLNSLLIRAKRLNSAN